MSGIVIVIVTMWISAGFGCIFTRSSEPFYIAFWGTLAVGFGYGLIYC